jgi:hypothetical protein
VGLANPRSPVRRYDPAKLGGPIVWEAWMSGKSRENGDDPPPPEPIWPTYERRRHDRETEESAEGGPDGGADGAADGGADGGADREGERG